MTTIGLYRVKNEAPWILKTLEQSRKVCDQIFLMDDDSDDRTPRIAEAVPEVTVLETPFADEDICEWRDKNWLWEQMSERVDPDYVLFLDGDEVLSKTAIEKIHQLRDDGAEGTYRFRIVYLWDRIDRERVDGIYEDFCRPRFFHVPGDPGQYRYKETGAGGFHCGIAPVNIPGATRTCREAEVIHYGYLYDQQRQRKYEWYNEIDPNNDAEGKYEHVRGEPDHLCPNPVDLVPYKYDKEMPEVINPDTKDWAVVVPSENAGNLEILVDSIYQTHEDVSPSDILVVDDGASEGYTGREVTWIDGDEPFVYARNVNKAVRELEGRDMFLIGDDSRIETDNLINKMREIWIKNTDVGILSAGIKGMVGNPDQKYDGSRNDLLYSKKGPLNNVDRTTKRLAFVAVYIPNRTIRRLQQAGDPMDTTTQGIFLDERFDDYGCEDIDLCWRILLDGMDLAVAPWLAVSHEQDDQESVFRSKNNFGELMEDAKQTLRDKWGIRVH